MKKSLFYVIATAIAMCMTLSISANENAKAETRLQGARFTAIDARTGVNVVLVPDSKTFIEVQGTEEALKHTVTKVKDNQLELYIDCNHSTDIKLFGKKISVNNGNCNYDVTVTVHYADIQKIEASSAAKVTSSHTVKANKLKVEASSAAKVELAVDVQQLELDASSAAEVQLTGKTSMIEAEASSAATVDINTDMANVIEAEASSSAEIQLRTANTVTAEASTGATIRIDKADNLKAEASTGGRIEIEYVDNLNAEADLGGSIKYKNNPTSVSKSTSMGGSVEKK